MTSIQKWVAALRSNQYQQGTQFLNHYNICFCPLGVLCELNRTQFTTIETDNQGLVSYDNHYRCLPWKHCEHYGFNDTFIHTIITMNDTGKSFKEIANYIENQLKLENIKEIGETNASPQLD